MATITSNGSGSWSAGGTWVGGSAPADNDAVVIAAGHSVLMDADLSAYTGLQTVTISGHATDPGMLYFKSGTSGYLKIRTGYHLIGTDFAAKGRLLANSDGVWGNTGVLPFADKAVIDLQGTSQIQAQYLDIALYCTEPTNKFVHVYGTKYDFNGATAVDTANDTIDLGTPPPAASTKVILLGGTMPTGLEADCVYYIRSVSGNTCKLALTDSDSNIVDITAVGSGTISLLTGAATADSTLAVYEDVTADTPWTTTTGHNRATLVSYNYDVQRVTLSTIAAAEIEISAATNSVQYPDARLILSSRNISIRGNGTSTTQAIVLYASDSTHGGVFGCEIVSMSLAGLYSYGFYYGSGHTISGTVQGCNTGIIYGSGHAISGTVQGCGYGFYSGSGHTISGTVQGCNTGIIYGSGHTISGTVQGCGYGFYYGSGHTISGTVQGCNTGFYHGSGHTISGTAILQGNTHSFFFPFGLATAYGGATIQQTFADRNTIGAVGRLAMEDYGGVPGAHKIVDNAGDIIKTACDGTGDAPSIDPDGNHGNCAEASNIQSNCGSINKLVIFDKHRVYLSAGTYTITYKVQTTYAAISAGNLELKCAYHGAAGVTTATNAPAIATRSADTDWTQTLSVTITTTEANWVDLSMTLMEYEAGNEVYVWPVPSGVGPYEARWSLGESVLDDGVGAGGGGIFMPSARQIGV
jgi:hypothetical protein